MASTLTASEEAQLGQTIEMFEVITQSQPLDYQSLEILKEAYSKLGRDQDVVGTSKRIAQAYMQMGQLSSAILEYETILQRFPEDPDVRAALKEIEGRASHASGGELDTATVRKQVDGKVGRSAGKTAPRDMDDGRHTMHKIFVDAKIIAPSDFDSYWVTPDFSAPPGRVIEPFIKILEDKGVLPMDKSLRLLSDKSRAGYLPINAYDIDIELGRTFPAETCQRWCVLPFDRMSKSILVATANPFNQQAAKELAEATPHRLLWYLAPPAELISNLRKVFR
jgi:hypothetical protein